MREQPGRSGRFADSFRTRADGTSGTAGDHALRLEAVDSGYPDLTVLRGIELSVARGEVVAVLGANGAGKTTLLRTIAGLITPTAGLVSVLGRARPDRHLYRTVHSGLAYVPDDRALFGELTVNEHLRLARGLDRDLVLSAFPALVPLLSRRASLLSGGEQQMLALSRALGSRPALLLVDELSLGLAPLVIDQILRVTSTLVREIGCSAVLVEQHVDRVLAVVDRVVVLARGTLALDVPAQVARQHGDALADAYLGAAPTDPQTSPTPEPPDPQSRPAHAEPPHVGPTRTIRSADRPAPTPEPHPRELRRAT